MWEKLTDWEKAFALVVFMGSVVDIYQFLWIVKKSFKSFRESIYNRIRKEVLLEAYTESKIKDPDKFPGIKGGE